MLRLRSICGILGLLFLVQIAYVECGLQLTSKNLLKSFYDKYATKEEVEFIAFSRNNMESIAEDTFKECKNMKILFITENPLREFPKDTLKYNTELRISNMQHLLITELHPDTFSSLRKIRHLYVHDTLLQEVDESLFRNNINLTLLNLASNRITEFHPKTFESLINLKNIALNNNRLTTLPDNVFAKNLQLEVVELQGNKFKTIPTSAFAPLINLREIDLGRNNLQSADLNSLSSNSKLETIHLYINRLNEIGSYDHAKELFPQLKKLKVFSNNLNCSYLNNMHKYFTSVDITLYPTIAETSYECVPDDKYRIASNTINDAFVPFESTYVYENPANGLSPGEAKMFELLLKEQRDCESGVKNLKLAILPIC